MPSHERLKTRIVPPVGPATARICFVGEAPGAEEDSAGEPFIGSAGQLLRRCMKQTGLIFSECIVGNVFLQRPPRNQITYYFQDKGCKLLTWEGQEHVDKLKQHLTYVRDSTEVNVVVALGRIATKILTGKKRIDRWRGSVLPCTLVEGLKVYCSYHPSYVQRLMNEQDEQKLAGVKKKQAQNVLPVFLRDLERVVIQSEHPNLPQEPREFSIDLSYGELLERLDYLLRAKPDTAVDIETLPSDYGPLLWCIGFAPSPAEAFVVPFIRSWQFAWPVEKEAQLLQRISEFFLSDANKIFHNGGYDLGVLGRYYGLRCKDGSYQDTMWLHHASYPYIRKALAVLASIYTWEPYYKDDGKVHFGRRTADSQEFIYNSRDCCVTREIYPIVQRDAKELNTWSGYRRTLDCFPSHLSMTLRGVKIDRDKKEKLSKKFFSESAYHASQVNELAGGDYNLNSPDDKRRILYGFLGLDIQYNRKTRKPTVDKEALQKLKKKYPKEPIVNHILEYQKYAKLASTYAEMVLDQDGRVRTSYNYVSTWRTSSSGSPFVFNLSKKGQAGGNLQNIPKRTPEGKEVRKLFVPDEGMLMGGSDLGQAEDRVVAWLARNLAVMEQYRSGKVDRHWEYTKEIFDIPDSVPYNADAKFKDHYTNDSHRLSEYRNLGKATRHATNYDMGPYQFQANLASYGFHLPYSVCEKLLGSAKSKDPFLAEWKRSIREQLKATRTLVTPLGRKRQFFGRLNDNTFRAAYAFIPQSTVGEFLQLAIQEIWERFTYIQPLLNVHDEVIFQIKPEDKARAIRDIRSAMERPLIINGEELVIPCDFKFGPSWGELKEIKE